MNIWFDELKEKLTESEIKKGDIVYISSDLTMLMYRSLKKFNLKGKDGKNLFMNKLVNTFQDMVGDEGTLMIPLFTWAFCRGIPFDVAKTHGEVGVLGNWVLENRPDFARTAHPLYSFCVWGKDKDKLVSMQNSTAWGQDSPFAYMHKNNAKNLLINVSLEKCFTFTHYVEECIHVPYRYFKDFKGTYIDACGNETERIYKMYVRDLDIESKQVTPDECLDEAKVATVVEFDGNEFRIVDLEKAYPVIVDNYKNHNGNQWYEFKNYTIDWTSGQTHPDEFRYE